MPSQLLSVVLPVHNQESHLAAVVAEYEEALSGIQVCHELLLVENGSRDGSLRVCRELSDRFEHVNVLESEPAGWGRAVRTGLAAARGDLLCYTNSARTGAQDLLLFVLYASVYSHVVIKANRRVRENWRRRLGSLLYNIECRTLFDLTVWDINGTPKVFPRAFDRLLHLSRDDDLIDCEFNIVCKREKYPVIEVPIVSTRRHGGRSSTNYLSALKMYVGAHQLWRSTRERRRLQTG
jgi:glycosyltransferase involved in cell wall biosynthesis